MNSLYSIQYDSPIGKLNLFSTAVGLCEVSLVKKDIAFENPNAILVSAKAQLEEYFEGNRTEFNVHVDFTQGTDFMQRVWHELRKIPFGKTLSYLDLARKVGTEKHTRAVGMANGKNPIPIIVPCHRVIGSDGSLTGFALGLNVKKFLLSLETQKVYGYQTSLF
jgi:methylated-DNA-[protein]-cysteine S-methyltransferase